MNNLVAPAFVVLALLGALGCKESKTPNFAADPLAKELAQERREMAAPPPPAPPPPAPPPPAPLSPPPVKGAPAPTL